MNKSILGAIAPALALLAVVACSPAPTPTPTQPPPPLPPTPVPKPTQVSQLIPTAAPPTVTAAPQTVAPQATAATEGTSTAGSSAPPQATATTAPPAAAASATPEAPPLAPPGLYIMGMRLDPPQPTHGQAVSFFVTFLNTATTEQNFKWQIYIFKSDTPGRRNNETSILQTTFRPGAVELPASGTFRFGATGNACDFFDAQVVWLDINNKGTPFNKTDGGVFDRGFSICQ